MADNTEIGNLIKYYTVVYARSKPLLASYIDQKYLSRLTFTRRLQVLVIRYDGTVFELTCFYALCWVGDESLPLCLEKRGISTSAEVTSFFGLIPNHTRRVLCPSNFKMVETIPVPTTANRPRTRQRAYKKPPVLDVPDIDQDATERKRILNVLAQRRYRKY